MRDKSTCDSTFKLRLLTTKQAAQLSQRDGVAGWLVMDNWNWETIFYGHYRPIFYYCDVLAGRAI